MPKLIDLTHTLNEQLLPFPGDMPPRIMQEATISTHGVARQQITIGTHIGTHIDAPCHMIAGAKKLSDFSLDTFCGRGVLLDARNKTIDEHLFTATKKTGASIALIHTGHDRLWGRTEYFENYPCLTKSFAQKLIEARIKMVVLDTPSPDIAPFAIHHMLFAHDILIVENACNFHELLGATAFDIIALPLKLELDGSPIRVIAHVQ